MNSIRHILEKKGRNVITIKPGQTVLRALEKMANDNISALIVTSTPNNIQGMFTERDYARRVALQGKSSSTLLIGQVMTPKVIAITQDISPEECMALMIEHHIRHLPVLDNGKLAGLISMGDVVKAVISEQEFEIKQLNGYITGLSA